MKDTGFIITGRMKSTRLKEKLILPLNGEEVIKQMINRAKLVFDPANIIIATSINPQDDKLETIAIQEGIKVFRGHEEDVIIRLYEAAKSNNLKYFINITADCPLFGFDFIKDIHSILTAQNADLVTSLDLPHGIFTYGIKTASIERILKIKKTDQTEVWGDYFYNNPNLFKVVKLPVDNKNIRKDYRLTLDYPEDYEFFKKIYSVFGNDTYKISSKKLIDYLDKNPDIVSINSQCAALYAKRWDSQRASNIEKTTNGAVS